MSGDELKRVRWRVRSALARSPRLYPPIAKLRHPDSTLEVDTELMIDGFTRSAIVFSTIGFQLAQSRPVRVAHTIHAPAMILRAAAQGVPVLVALRDPREVAMSAVVRQPFLSLNDILRAYARFYEAILPVAGSFVIGPFEQLSTDLGSVIVKVNDRYRTSFARFEHTERNVREAFEIADDRARGVPWLTQIGLFQAGKIGVEEYRAIPKHRADAPKIPENRVPRPSELRATAKDQLRQQLEEPAVRPALRRALAIYGTLHAQDTPGPAGKKAPGSEST